MTQERKDAGSGGNSTLFHGVSSRESEGSGGGDGKT